MKDYEQAIAAMSREDMKNCLLRIATAFDQSQSHTDVYYNILDTLHRYDLDYTTEDEPEHDDE